VFGLSIVLDLIVFGLLLSLVSLVGFIVVVQIRYGQFITRIFEERPVFLPLRVPAADQGEPVTLRTQDGLSLTGTYIRRRNPDRVGVLVFCHEYLSDRWSYFPYLDHLRDVGYDLFIFDFRNHGNSERDPNYAPLQWATDHEVRDLQAALDYLRSRPDHDPAGFGLFGVSRGGSTALVVAAEERDVWGVVTDGAFPTRGTMTAYIVRWAEIYVHSALFLAVVPRWIYAFLGWVSRLRSQRRLNCRFPDIETSVSRLSPRPWLMIHGGRDVYIGPAIAQGLFDYAREPKEMWLVPEAKHNRCRESQPEAYAGRITDFLNHFAPRRSIEAATASTPSTTVRKLDTESEFSMEPVKLLPDVTASVPG
jgi:pimeloyl-ACP methyl ester carboxylesterase